MQSENLKRRKAAPEPSLRDYQARCGALMADGGATAGRGEKVGCLGRENVDIDVRPCNRAIVNVTIKLDNALCREARHRSVDEGLSLSGWVGKLIAEAVAAEPAAKRRGTLLELVGDERAADVELELPKFSDLPATPHL